MKDYRPERTEAFPSLDITEVMELMLPLTIAPPQTASRVTTGVIGVTQTLTQGGVVRTVSVCDEAIILAAISPAVGT